MTIRLEEKSTTAEIRARFDQDVERFSRLETGQQATIDAPLVLDLVAQTSAMHLHPMIPCSISAAVPETSLFEFFRMLTHFNAISSI
jgi:hypothetical protein